MHLDLRCGGVEFQVRLADLAGVFHRHGLLRQAPGVADAFGLGGGRDEGHRGVLDRTAIGAPHRPRIDRLRRRDRSIGIAHLRTGNGAAQKDHLGLHPEERRVPEHQVGAFANLDRADFMRQPMRDGRVDGVFGDIAADAEIVVVAGFLGEPAALFLHLVGGLPGADQHLADPTHGLAVRRDDRKRAHVVQDVLGGDGFAPDAALGKGHILGDRLVEVVTDHEHVEMFLERVHGKRPRRVGRRGQNVLFAADLDDIGGVAAAGALGVKGVDGAAFHGLYRVLDKAALVKCIGVDHHLHVHVIGHAQAAVDGAGGGAPILVQFQRAGAALDLFDQGFGQRGIALAGKGQVHRKGVRRLQHPPHMPGAGGAGGGQRSMRRAGATAQHGGQAGMQRILDLLRADEMNVAVETAGGQDAAFAGDHLGAGPDDDGHAGLGVGVAGLADGGDPAVFQADIGFHDAGVIHDQRIGDDGIHRTAGPRDLGLAHAITDHLAAAELDLFTVGEGVPTLAPGERGPGLLGGEVAFDFDDQVGIGQPQAVADGGAEHGGVIGAFDRGGHLRGLPSHVD